MMIDIQRLVDGYAAWLKEKTQLKQVGQWIEITTPYLDRHNDCIQIYAQRTDRGYTLTADGYAIGDLEQCGCTLGGSKRQELLKTTLNGFGVRLAGERLEVDASASDFALRKHNLIQAILAVSDLFYLTVPQGVNLFIEDVAAWLDAGDIRYTPDVKFVGKSGLDHNFHFAIPKSRRQS